MGLKSNLVFPTGKFTIRNKEKGLFLSIVGGKLAFTETKETNSDWSVQDSNGVWGTIASDTTNKVLDITMTKCDKNTNSCPTGLWWSNGASNQKWRRSGDKIVAALPGYLAQDNSGNVVVVSSTNDNNKDWIKLEIGNILTDKTLR